VATNHGAFHSLISEGQRRADLHHLPFDRARDAEAKLEAVLRGWPTDSRRFVQIFCELTVLAEAARLNYDEQALKEDDLRAFLGVLGLLASARVKFEWSATQIQRQLDSKVSKTDVLPADQQWPATAESHWTVSLICCFLAALTMLIFV
jgi:hypothetical protein